MCDSSDNIEDDARDTMRLAGLAVDHGLPVESQDEQGLIASRKTQRQQIEELADKLGLLNIILDSLADGILVIQFPNQVVCLNTPFTAMWGFTRAAMEKPGGNDILALIATKIRHPGLFTEEVKGLFAKPQPDFSALIELNDERFFEYSVKPIQIGRQDEGLMLNFRDTTARQKLQRDRAQLAAIVENSNDAIISKSLNGIISSWNTAAEKIFGYCAAEAIGQPMTMLIPPELADEEALFLSRMAKGENLGCFETVRIRKDGRAIDVSVTLSPIRDHDGGIIGISKIVRDITENKKNRQQLLDYSNRLELATHAANIGIWEYAIASGALLWDGQMLQIYGIDGVTHFEPSHEAWLKTIHPEDRDDVEAQFKLAAGGEKDLDMEFRIIRPSGSIRTIIATGNVICDDAGLPVRMVGINWDGTYQKQLEQALYAEKERAEVTLASIGDAVITTDHQGNVTFLNHVACDLTGWTEAEAVGKPMSEIFHIVSENSRTNVGNPVDLVLKDGKSIMLANQTVLISRDGKEYNIEDSAAPIYLKDNSLLGCVLVFHDVTEKHRLLNRVRWQAGHDVLTGLPNRALLADRFERALNSAKRQQTLLGVCMVDLDEFKPVNDRCGHEIGDHLLVEVANRLNQVVRGEDTVARLGGDEFALLFGNLKDINELEIILQRMLGAVSASYLIKNNSIQISASIGVTVYPFDNADADTLLRHADQAMYQAKQAGRNRFQLFDVAYAMQAQHLRQTP